MNESLQSNIYLVGMMGAGKSTLGKAIADLMDMKFVDMDELIEQQENQPIPQIFADRGEDYFRKVESDILQSLSAAQGLVIATGGGSPCFFEGMDIMLGTGRVVWLQRSLKRIYQDIQNSDRPIAQRMKFNAFQRLFRKRKPTYKQAHLAVRNSDKPPLVALRLKKKLSRLQN